MLFRSGGEMRRSVTEEEIKRSILKVVSPYEGSAFMAGPQLAVSCIHVCVPDGASVAERQEVKLKYQPYGQGAVPITLRAYYLPEESDPEHDLAVIRLELPGGLTIPPVPLSLDDQPSERVVAFGFPTGQPITTIRRVLGTIDPVNYLDQVKFEDPDSRNSDGWTCQVLHIDTRGQEFWSDQLVRPGMSGGPIWNKRTGTVVAVVEGRKPRGYTPGDIPEGFGIELKHLVACSAELRPHIQVIQAPVSSEPVLQEQQPKMAAPREVAVQEPLPGRFNWKWKALAVLAVLVLVLAFPFYFLLLQNTGKPIDPTVQVFSVENKYVPSGIMGNTGDVTIGAGESGGHQFIYETKWRGPHEWDQKYVADKPNPELPQWAGVMYLSPPNAWGTDSRGGYDLRGFRRIVWKARSLEGTVNVEFIIGGVTWMWDDKRRKKVDSPYPDTMPNISLGTKKLTPQWQSFDDGGKLSELSEDNFKRVVGGFGWIITWGSNGIELNDERTGPKEIKKFKIEISDVHYER
jgi:hypothetical protein